MSKLAMGSQEITKEIAALKARVAALEQERLRTPGGQQGLIEFMLRSQTAVAGPDWSSRPWSSTTCNHIERDNT